MTPRVLVVEDEMTIALLLEDMIDDLGYEIAGLAMRLPQAMELARTIALDVAILDVNLDGHMSYPVADALDARQIPYIFATGYGSGGIAPGYRDRTIVQKPYEIHDVRKAIEAALLQDRTRRQGGI